MRLRIIAVAICLVSIAVGQTPTSNVPQIFFGMHTNNYNQWPAFLGALGKGTLVNWQYSEPSRGSFNWSRLDAWVAAAQQHGLTITYANGGIPKWAVSSTDTSQCAPESVGSTIENCYAMVANISDWDNFVTKLATRYKGKLIYELWNEPRANGTYLTVADMVKLTEHEYSIIRSIDPGATILCCAFRAYNNYQYMGQYFAAGGVTGADGISFHGIFKPPAPPAEAIVSEVSTVRQIMSSYGLSAKPLFDTEGGWAILDPPSDSDKPGWVAKWYLLQWFKGVKRAYWYGWNNWRPLWSSTSGINAAGIAYEQVSNWLMGATMKPCVILSDGSTWTCPLTRANGYQGLVVWNANGSKSYTPSSIYTQYRTLSKQSVQIKVGSTITITRNPIVLETFTP